MEDALANRPKNPWTTVGAGKGHSNKKSSPRSKAHMDAEHLISRHGARMSPGSVFKTLESRIKGAPKIPKVIPNIVLASPVSQPKRSSIATTHKKTVGAEPYMVSSVNETTARLIVENISRASKE